MTDPPVTGAPVRRAERFAEQARHLGLNAGTTTTRPAPGQQDVTVTVTIPIPDGHAHTPLGQAAAATSLTAVWRRDPATPRGGYAGAVWRRPGRPDEHYDRGRSSSRLEQVLQVMAEAVQVMREGPQEAQVWPPRGPVRGATSLDSPGRIRYRPARGR